MLHNQHQSQVHARTSWPPWSCRSSTRPVAQQLVGGCSGGVHACAYWCARCAASYRPWALWYWSIMGLSINLVCMLQASACSSCTCVHGFDLHPLCISMHCPCLQQRHAAALMHRNRQRQWSSSSSRVLLHLQHSRRCRRAVPCVAGAPCPSHRQHQLQLRQQPHHQPASPRAPAAAGPSSPSPGHLQQRRRQRQLRRPVSCGAAAA